MSYTAAAVLAVMLVHCCTAIEFSPPGEEETLRNIIQVDQNVVIGSSNALYRINLNSLSMAPNASLTLTSANRLLVANVGGSFNGNFLSCDNSQCFLADIRDFANMSWLVQPPIIRTGDSNVAGVFAPSLDGTTELIFGESANGLLSRRFAKGGLTNVDFSGPSVPAPTDSIFSKIAEKEEDDINESFDYHTHFAYNGFVYFVTSPVEMETLPSVARFCQNDTGLPGGGFRSHFEIKLSCHGDSGIITAATFVTTAPFNEPTILISTVEEDTMEMVRINVCAFSLTEIDQLMFQKYTECSNAVGVTGFKRAGLPAESSQCRVISPEIQAVASVCNVPDLQRQGLEVMAPLAKMPIIFKILPEKEHLTSLTTTVMEGALFVFAGSSRSRLHQFHVLNESSIVLIRSISLNEVPGTNVTHLLSSTDGENIFAMTPNKLLMHTVDQCHTLTDCLSCVTSNDPICGWCALSGTCVRNSACPFISDASNTMQKVYVRSESACPRIESSQPSIIHIEQLGNEQEVQITLATANILNSAAEDFEYNCVFRILQEGASKESSSLARPQQASNTFTCSSPGEDFILPGFPPMTDTVNATVSLRPSQTGIDYALMESAIEYTDCSVHISCGSCISSGVGKCRWCPLSFECISDLSSSTCQNAQNGETSISFSNTCQAILPHPNTINYLVHSGHTYSSSPLIVSTQQLDIFQGGQFSCRVCVSDSCSGVNDIVVESSAVFNSQSNLVRCDLDTIVLPLSLDTPSVDLTLKVLFNDFEIDNPTNVKVTVYACQYKGSNCAQCLSLDAKFECSFCGPVVTEPGICGFNAGAIPPRCPSDQAPLSRVQQCNTPQIVDFFPKDGPTSGGTEISISGHNLGVIASDIGRISIGGVACNRTSYRPGVGLNCTTGSMRDNLVNDRVIMALNFQLADIMSTEDFSYLAPSLDIPPVIPDQGPASGGTLVTVNGRDLGIGSRREVFIRRQACQVVNFTVDTITCVTAASFPVLNNLLEVRIDDWVITGSGYDYLSDPTFESISPMLSFSSGGTNYTVIGQNFHIIQAPHLLVYVVGGVVKRQADIAQPPLSMPCEAESSTVMKCMAPSLTEFEGLLQRLPAQFGIGLELDGVTSLLTLNTSITVHQNPTINEFEAALEFSQNDIFTLTITGENFLFSVEDVRVVINPCLTTCSCSVVQVYSNNNSLVCEVMDPEDLTSNKDLSVTVHVGLFSGDAGTIRIVTNLPLLVILLPAFAGFIILCVVIFIVLFAVFCRKTRQKDQRYDQLMMELERLESSVARECKLGFAELQTDLDELTGDVAGCRLPYHDLQNFFLATLFPDYKDHPILHRVQVPAHQQPLVNRALREFGDLLNDQKVLLLFIQTLEEQRSFSIRDKSTVGSLLIVALHDRMDYVTDVLKKLLTRLIRKTVANSNPKLLLRRTESIAERILTNWLAFCLQGYIMDHAGQPMFMLYRAVKNQLEKGPVDVITGEARYSLSEQKLIRQKVDVVPISATVETEDGLRVPVKLLDCDTISQVKEKLLDSMHKAAPVSKRPKLTEVDLEYLKSPSETMILRDEDHSMVVEGGWKRLNTLRHYWVHDGAMFRIKSRKDHAPPGRVYDYPGSIISTHSPRQRALSEAEDGTRVWHLFKQAEMEDPKRSPFLNKKMVSEIYLPRMLSTKSILQNFVDELFDSLFSLTHPPSSPTASSFPQSPGAHVPMGYAPGADAVPMAVKYLFDFLDDAADDCKITDSDVMHTWKNNSLALRFWVNLIKNPEFVFDINKSHTVDACLSVVAQAFIDGCSSADTKLNIDSPTSKLLYNKEVQAYKIKVKKFYSDVKQMPRIPEDAMQYFLRQLSEYQSQQMKKTGGFVTDSAVNELLRYAVRYSEPFLNNLKTAGLPQRANQFEGVLQISRSSTLL